jgi:hypothetical protein
VRIDRQYAPQVQSPAYVRGRTVSGSRQEK